MIDDKTKPWSDLALNEQRDACATVRTRFAGRATLERRRDAVSVATLGLKLGLATTVDVLRARLALAMQYRDFSEAASIASAIDASAARAVESARRDYVSKILLQKSPGVPLAFAFALAHDDYAARESLAASVYARISSTAIRDRDLCAPSTAIRDRDLCALVAPRECAAIDSLRKTRKESCAIPAATTIVSRLQSWRAVARAIRLAILRSHEDCAAIESEARQIVGGFRTATHDHTTVIEIVERGNEHASSVNSTSWKARNKCASYKYPNAASVHLFCVSSAIQDPVVRALNARAGACTIWLSETCRVRQGRGTSLVIEHVRRSPAVTTAKFAVAVAS